MTADNVQTINRINGELARLLADTANIDDLRCNPSGQQAMRNAAELITPHHGFTIVSLRGSQLSPLAYRVRTVARDLEFFWQSNGPAYSAALRQIRLPLGVITRYPVAALACFFETVGLADSRPVADASSQDMEMYLRICALNQVRGLLEVSSGPPLAVIVPWEVKMRTREFLRSLAPSGPVELSAGELWLADLLSISARDDLAPRDLAGWLNLMSQGGRIPLGRLVHVEMWRRLLDGFTFSNQAKGVEAISGETAAELEALIGADFDRDGNVSPLTLSIVISEMASQLSKVAQLDMVAQEWHMTPHVESAGAYSFAIERQARYVGEALGLSLNAVAARAIRLKPLEWFASIPSEDVVRLREAGVLEELRKGLASEVARLGSADVSQFEATANDVAHALDELIDAEGHRIAEQRARFTRSLRHTALSFSGTVALGVISTAVQLPLSLGIPLTALSALVGTASAADLWKILQQRGSVASQVKRPLAMLVSMKTPKVTTSASV